MTISILPVIYLTFCMLCLYTLHTQYLFTTQKQYILMRCEPRNNTPTTIAVGRHHTGALNN